MENSYLESDFDPTIHEDFTTAHDQFKRLRSTCPVAYSKEYDGYWGVFRYEDVVRILKDNNFVTSVQNVVPRVATTGRRPPLHLDPPEHTPYRQTIVPFLAKRKLKELEPYIRQTVISLLNPLIEKGEGDICEDFSRKLPGYIFECFFNIERELALEIREVTKEYVSALHQVNNQKVQESSQRLYKIAQTMIDMRKKNPMNPEDDIVSAFLVKKHNGELLPKPLVLGTIRQLIVVGMIAPVIFIGSMTVHLSENKGIQQRIRNNISLVPAAIEEYLRLFTPYRGFARTPKKDVVIGGRTIKKDEPIAVVFSSANRDESIFPEPDQFIINRPNIKKHIAFGVGPHSCPGAPLARLMLRITLEELLQRTNDIELNGDIKMARWPEWGAISVPIKIS